ncbi:hypothetical protein E4U31_003071 [Claviceps sp. LM219 group G6]|nr:hypothetical protein E4U31_003071 [Claviceps sp. LM219 group G6]KAG6116617.1 hypothetical protein E4U14_008495 [Claviceps sp. LM454 group G7]
MFTKDEAAALPQALYYLFDWQKNVPRVVMIETVRLSYLAVIDIRSGFNPVEIFVRGELHNTKLDRRSGEVETDPDGWHLTVSFKTQELVNCRKHLTCHAYVDSLGQFKGASIIETTPKADRTRRFKSKQPFWLAKAKLVSIEFALQLNVTDPDYSHFVTLMQTDSSTVGPWDTVSARAAGNRINIGRSKGSGGKLKQ